MSAEPFIPPEEGEIVIKGTYTTKSGQEVPVEIHTNQHGLIYQRWREEQAARTPATRAGGGVRELKEGEVYSLDPITKFQKQALPFDIPKAKERTLLEVFAEEKAKDLAKIQGRLDELRAELRPLAWCDHEAGLCTKACQILEEITRLEKQLLGDP